MQNPLFLTLAISLLLAPALFAQTLPGDADAEYLDVTHEYILHPDGSTTYNYEHHLKLRSYFSFNRAYGESFVVYNPAWQTLKIRHSETVMADGRKVSAPFNAFNEVLPGFCAGAPPYAHLREMVVTHTGLERDAVVHFSYTITTKAGMLPGLTGKVVCGERSPIRNLTIVVRTPGNTPLMYAVTSPNPSPAAAAPLPDPIATAEAEGSSSPVKQNVYTWTIKDIPLTAVESAQPPLEQCVPTLFFSTVTRRQAVRHVLGDERTLYRLSPAAAARVKELTARAADELAAALALRSYVENSVGSMSGDLVYLGFRPLAAQECYDRNVGSGLDRAVLLAAMLKAAGCEAAPLLSSDFSSFLRYAAPAPGKPGGAPVRNAEDLACLPAFAKAAVVCRLKSGESYLLDPNGPQPGRFPARYVGKPYMVLSENSYSVDRLLAPPSENVIRLLNNWRIKPDLTIDGSAVVHGGGIFGAAYQKEQFAASAKRRVESGAQGLTAKPDTTQVSSTEISIAGFSLSSLKPLEASDGIIACAIPAPPGGLSDLHVNFGKIPRSTVLDLPAAFSEEDLTTILLPAGLAPAMLPDPLGMSNDVGEMKSTVTATDTEVRIVRRIQMKTARITPDLYDQFQALVCAWADPRHQQLLFERR